MVHELVQRGFTELVSLELRSLEVELHIQRYFVAE